MKVIGEFAQVVRQLMRLVDLCRDLSDLSIDHVPEAAIAVAEDYIMHGRSKARGGVGYQKAWRVEDLPEGGPAET